MEVRPEQPPEGRLIAEALKRSGLSIREASRRAGISYGRWRQITTGVQNVSPGNFAAVHAPAATVAKMARVVGVPPEQMETEGQRPDAADEMRREPVLRVAPEPLDDNRPEVTPAMAEAMAPYEAAISRYVARARTRHPGQRQLTGAQVFPDSPVDQVTWDRLSPGRSDDLVAFVLASIWAHEAAEAADERRRSRGT